MNSGEVKLDSLRLFDTFGFGSAAVLLLYLLGFRNANLPSDLALDGLSNLPTALVVPIATGFVFMLHLIGKAFVFLGFMISNSEPVKRQKIELELALLNHAYSTDALLEMKSRLRFSEGVLGLSSAFFVIFGSMKVSWFIGLSSNNPSVDWHYLIVLVGVAWGSYFWHKITLLQMEIFPKTFELATMNKMFKTNSAQDENQSK